MKSFSCDLLVSERERLGSGSGQLHCVFHYLDEETDIDSAVSHFSVVRIHIDNFGHIHSKKLFKEFLAITGHWRIPFVIDDKIYSIAGDEIPEKMVEIQMSANISDNPNVTVSRLHPHQSATSAFPTQAKWSRPIVNANFALWYVFDKTTSSGECWTLDMGAKQWTKLWDIRENQHAVSHSLTVECRSPSVVLLYGECCDSSCKKSHIYSVHLQTENGEFIEQAGDRQSQSEGSELNLSIGNESDTVTPPLSAASRISEEPDADDGRCFCVACMENSPNVLFLPCKHLVLCINCSNRAGRTCPFCRSTVLHKISGCFLPS
uniref:RING-type domain-containing protein n=1 Tax=Plectus sambesii TaxID=2011161 RepID=A0A914W1C9_9BILA